jgi:menaquinone-dependent protoporphyrinogen oxidase
MRVLIVVASKHGSTREIADALADTFQSLDLTAEVADACAAPDPAGYDAVVVGSALYMGHWLPQARAFVMRHQEALQRAPVWLFSSGPLGEPPTPPPAESPQLVELLAASGAREHRVFVGKLDRGALGLGEKLAVKLVKAPEGDFRDWDTIRAWAREITGALETGVATDQPAIAVLDPPGDTQVTGA